MNNHFEQLVAYIREQQSSGHGDPEIRQTLIAHGWDQKMVDDGFGYISYNSPVDQPIVPQPVESPVQSTSAPEQQWPSNDFVQQQAAPQASIPDVATPKSKYKLFQAAQDVVRTLRYGFWRFLGVVVLAYLATAAVYALFAFGFAALFISMLTSGTAIILMLIGASIVGAVFYAFSWAMLVSSTSYGLLNSSKRGAETLLMLIKQTLSSVWRVTIATLLLSFVVIGPIVLLYVLLFATLFSGVSFETPNPANVIVMLIIPLLVAVWVGVALLRFSLVPYVALFEKDVPLLKTLKRSNFLLIHGGQWFLFKEGLVAILLICITVLVSGQNLTEMQNAPGVISLVFTVSLTIMIVAVNYMLYVNRKSVRG